MFNLKKIYSERDPWVYKGNFGKLLIVAGSKDYTGSPIYNGMAALRAGVDLVYIFTPERVSNIVSSYAPELLTIPYDSDYLTEEQVGEILEIIKQRRVTALVLGGGLGRAPKTQIAVQQLIKRVNLPMAIDADAVRALEKRYQILKNKRAVLTLHADEFRQLTGETVKPEFNDRRDKVKKWSRKIGVPILLKGHIDVGSDGKEVYLNRGGSVLMTKGGFGDVLVGICGALLARGIPPFESLCAASYITNKAGELVCEKFGEGVLASDIFEVIPKIIS